MDFSRLKIFLLNFIQESALGCVAALLPKGTPPEAIAVGKRGAEVLIDLLTDQVDDGATVKTLPLNLHTLYRGDAKVASAGEILASIQKALEGESLQLPDGTPIEIKHRLNSHTCLAMACTDEESGQVTTPSLDLHTAGFELKIGPTPEAAKS